MTSYRVGGSRRQVVVWGALNARQPSARVRQVRFKLDYSGRSAPKGYGNVCRGYSGPGLPWFAAGCAAPDGSFWAVQSWQRALPDLGFAPWLPAQSVWELRISHWTGPLARLEVYSDWVYGGRFHELFGRLSYRGGAVHGFRTTR